VSLLGDFVRDYGWLGTAIVTVAGAIWAVTRYLQNAKLEYVKDFNVKQINTFFKTAETVASLVAEVDQQKWTEHQTTFWHLYYGDLVLFENPGIECAMTYFGAKLNNTKFEGRGELGPYAFAVSQELRKFIENLNQNDWRINLTNLVGAKDVVRPILGLKSEALDELKIKIKPMCGEYMNPPGEIGSAH
jgi:hypothetical protein